MPLDRVLAIGLGGARVPLDGRVHRLEMAGVRHQCHADDVEACLAAVRLAMMYRDKYAGDCVIDLVGYRRHGHNEGDEPRYTQPKMYQVIDQHPTALSQYSEALVKQGILSQDQVKKELIAHYELLSATQAGLKEDVEIADDGEADNNS